MDMCSDYKYVATQVSSGGSPYSYFVGGADVQLYAQSSQSVPSHATQTFLVKIFCTVTLTANTEHGYIVFSRLIREICSDEFYIPGFSTDELDIIVSTSSAMQLEHNHFCL